MAPMEKCFGILPVMCPALPEVSLIVVGRSWVCNTREDYFLYVLVVTT